MHYNFNLREDEAYAEECTGEEVTKQHRSIMKQVHYLIDRHQHYKVATTLQEELEKLDSITNITTRAFEKSFSKFSDNVAIFVQETEDFIDDEQISPIHQLLKASVARLLKHITESQATDHPTSVMHAHKEQTKFNLELPSFSGKPIDWADFFLLI